MNDGSVDARLVECAADAIGPCLVRVNTRTRVSEIVEQLDQQVAFFAASIRRTLCSTRSAVLAAGVTETSRVRSNSPASARMSLASSLRRTGSAAAWATPGRCGGSA